MRTLLKFVPWPGLILLALVSAAGCAGRAHWVLNALSQFRPQYAAAAVLLIPAGSNHRPVFVRIAMGD